MDRIDNIINRLDQGVEIFSDKVATIGFDGFIDRIVRVVKSKNHRGEYDFFHEIKSFGEFLTSKHEKSCSMELKCITVKMGGNAPILANALRNLGIGVNCIGAMGYPGIEKAFEGMASGCKLLSYAEPSITTAIEFNDGKIMLADMEPVCSVTWEDIKEAVGLDTIIECFSNSDIFGLVNWSEMNNSTFIWEGLLREVMPKYSRCPNQKVLFDLADCSRHSSESINGALKIINDFSEFCDVVISMNENEAGLVFKAMTGEGKEPGIDILGRELYYGLGTDILVIHTNKYSIAWDCVGMKKLNTLHVETPLLSTGAGDNFNAGFCTGLIMGLDTIGALIIAHAVSGFYLRMGYSPSLSELKDFITKYKDALNNTIN